MRKYGYIILIVVLALFASTVTAQGLIGVVDTDDGSNLLLRETSNGEVVGRIPNGSRVEILGNGVVEAGIQWVQVSYQNQVGFVSFLALNTSVSFDELTEMPQAAAQATDFTPGWVQIDMSDVDLTDFVAYASQYPGNPVTVGEAQISGIGESKIIDFRLHEGEFGLIQGSQVNVPGLGIVGSGCVMLWMEGPVSFNSQPTADEFPSITLFSASFERYAFEEGTNVRELVPQKLVDLMTEYPRTCGQETEIWIYQQTDYTIAALGEFLATAVDEIDGFVNNPTAPRSFGYEGYISAPTRPNQGTIAVSENQILLVAGASGELNGLPIGGSTNCFVVAARGPLTVQMDWDAGSAELFAVGPEADPLRWAFAKHADLVQSNPTTCGVSTDIWVSTEQ